MTNNVGIIGGADGPTMIMVSGNPVGTFLLIGVGVLLIGAVIGFAVGYAVGRHKRHHHRHN